jgi:hypothetical protein
MFDLKTYLEPQKSINVYGKYDVVVVGGGCAGFPAAVAAARNGARTLIIERFPYFGGTATASLMGNINGFRNQVEPDGLQTTKGIGEEVILKLKEIGGLGEKNRKTAYNHKTHSDTKGDLSYCYAVDTEKFKYITLKMVYDAGVDILFHTYFSDVIMDGEKLAGIIIENKSGRQAVFSKVFVDASGDGDVAFRAGVPFWQTRKEEAPRLNDGLMYKVAGYPEQNTIGGCDADTVMYLWGPSPGALNGADAKELTLGEIKARLAVPEDFEKKKTENPELRNAKIVETGPLLGIRQTRFIEGLYKITGEDVLEGKTFEDSIAMASSPIIHYYGYRRFLTHEGYEIPYRCLLPQKVNSLIVAGRCMSSDQRAYESWRAMAHIMAIGEAAGVASALSADSGVDPKQLDIQLLRSKLIEQGAEIGQNRNNQ